jgi:hypothetical protein
MNIFNRMYCRTYQKIIYWISFSLKWSEPELHEGAGSLKDIPFILNQKNRIHPLIVTDPGIYKLGLQSPLIQVSAKRKSPMSFTTMSFRIRPLMWLKKPTKCTAMAIAIV